MSVSADEGSGIQWANQRLAQGKAAPGGFAEEIPFGVWMTDAEGGLRYASEKFLELLDLTMEQAKGSGWTERIASDDKDSFRRWMECVHNQQDWQDEHQVRDREGNIRTLLAHGLPVREDSGQISCWIGVHIDITKRKKAEELVREARNFAESVVATVREPLVALDSELRVVTANRSFYRTFQTTPKETETRCIYDLGNGQWNIHRFRVLLEDTLTNGTSFDDYEVEHDFPAIGRKVMLLNARRLRQNDSKKEMILLAIEDVTQQKQAEERLTMIRMTQAQQQERENLARRLHDHVQQLLVAAQLHVGNLGVTEDGSERREQSDETQRILNDAIEATRNFAVELNPPVLFESGLMAALNWLRDWMQTHYALDVEIRADSDTRLDEPEICVLLFETVRELLFNVVKYAKVDRASVEAEKVEDNQLRLVVSDDGVGFDPERVAMKSDPAAGFGLASIRHRIESVGGSLQIDASPGKGTTVTVIVPLRQAD